MNGGADRVVLSVEDGVAAFGAVLLDFPARRTPRLVANEEDVVTRIAEDGLEVIEDAADAERRNEDAALVAKGVFAESLQAPAAVLATLVRTIAVRAFEDDDIGAIGDLGAGSSAV